MAGSRQHVMHGCLMLQHHQRHNVTVTSQIWPGIYQTRKVSYVGPGITIQLLGFGTLIHPDIAHVTHAAVGACHIPAAPSFRKRTGIIIQEGAQPIDR